METYRISNSSMKTIQRCEQQYFYKYVLSLQPKLPKGALRLGSWMHALIEAKFKHNTWAHAHKMLTNKFNNLFDVEREYYGDLPTQAQTIMKGYDYHWKRDADEWKILGTELKVEVPLGSTFTYVGKIDVEAENDDGIWLWDHKTFKNKQPSSDFRTTDPQSSLYDWAYEKITGNKPAGFIFDYIRTKLPAIPRLLKNGTISQARNIDTNYITLARTIQLYKLNPLDYREQLSAARARDKLFFDRIYIPRPAAVIKNLLEDIKIIAPRVKELHEGRRPTRTLTFQCQQFCDYHMLCMTELIGGDGTYIKKHDYVHQEWGEYDGNQEEA